MNFIQKIFSLETATGIYQRILNFYEPIDPENVRVENFGFGLRIFIAKLNCEKNSMKIWRKNAQWPRWPRLTQKKEKMIEIDADLIEDEEEINSLEKIPINFDEVWDCENAEAESGAESEGDDSETSDVETFFNAGV